MRDAIQYANTKGVLVVAAGGNGGAGGNEPTYPAAYDAAIAVAAVDSEPRTGPVLATPAATSTWPRPVSASCRRATRP